MPDAAMQARRIASLIERHRIDVSTEAAAAQSIAQVLTAAGIEHAREVVLSRGDRIDIVADTIGIEIKIAGGRRQETLRQLARYARHDSIAALVLATGAGWPMSTQATKIEGKTLIVASLARGWM